MALENFLSCNSTLRSVEQLSLKFGVYNADGSSLDGCVTAKLVQSIKLKCAERR